MLQSSYARLRLRVYQLFENELVRRMIKNSGYLFSATGVSAALSLFQSMLAGKLLGAAGFGILGNITTFITVINNLASFRMGELVIKYVGHYHETGDPQRAAAVFKAAAIAEMLASFVAFALVWALAPLGDRLFNDQAGLANLFVVYGLIILANLIAESSTGLLQIFDRFRPIAITNAIQSVITLVVIAWVYIQQGGLLGILLAYVAGKTFSALALTGTALLEATRRWGRGWWRTPLSLLRPQWRELSHFAVSTNLSASLSLVNKNSELLWVSLFRPGSVETGYYKLALALSNFVQMPIAPLPQATYPEISREVAHQNWRNVRYIMRQGSRLAGGYSLVVTLALIVAGRPLISILYKPEFLPAYPALLILLAGLLVANTFYWQRTTLLALGRPDFPTKVNFVLAILKIAGVFLLVPRFGYLASAALMAGSYILGVGVSALKVNRLIAAREKPA